MTALQAAQPLHPRSCSSPLTFCSLLWISQGCPLLMQSPAPEVPHEQSCTFFLLQCSTHPLMLMQSEQRLLRKRVGRPLTYKGDPNSPALTPQERRKIRRRIANRESARRVRARRQEELETMKQQVSMGILTIIQPLGLGVTGHLNGTAAVHCQCSLHALR